MVDVALRARTPGAVQAFVEVLDDRSVVVVRMDASERRGALSSTASGTLAEAARAAKDQRLPLVAHIASSGADIVEGMAALHGWGQAAKAIADCSGVVPVIMVVDGPAVSGPALLLGLADFVVMTAASYAFLSGPAMVAEFTGRGHRQRRARRVGRARPPERRGDARRRPTRRRPSWPSRAARLPAVAHRRGAAAVAQRRPARPPDPGGGRAPAHDDDRQLRRARRDGGDRRRRDRARAPGAVGAEPGHRLRHDRRTPGRHPRQPAAGHRRHARHPGLAEGRPLRRRSATRSTCRSSPSSTRRASTPARTWSGGA